MGPGTVANGAITGPARQSGKLEPPAMTRTAPAAGVAGVNTHADKATADAAGTTMSIITTNERPVFVGGQTAFGSFLGTQSD
jgi:hypothetical protein